MKIAAGHESKHKAAMSKAGDLVVVIPISTTPETLRMGRGAVVNSSKAQTIGVIFACTKHTGSWPAASPVMLQGLRHRAVKNERPST